MTVSYQDKPDLDELVDVLIHYGVKGMRWGVRHRQEVHRRITEKSIEKHGAPTRYFISGGEKVYTTRGNYKELKREVLSDMKRERQLATHKNGVDKIILKAGKSTLSNVQTYLKRNNIKPGMTASEFLKNF